MREEIEIVIVGKKIIALRPMTKKEMEREGWESWNRSSVLLELEGGIKLYASCDEEGNGPGAIFGHDKKGSFQLG